MPLFCCVSVVSRVRIFMPHHYKYNNNLFHCLDSPQAQYSSGQNPSPMSSIDETSSPPTFYLPREKPYEQGDDGMHPVSDLGKIQL